MGILLRVSLLPSLKPSLKPSLAKHLSSNQLLEIVPVSFLSDAIPADFKIIDPIFSAKNKDKLLNLLGKHIEDEECENYYGECLTYLINKGYLKLLENSFKKFNKKQIFRFFENQSFTKNEYNKIKDIVINLANRAIKLGFVEVILTFFIEMEDYETVVELVEKADPKHLKKVDLSEVFDEDDKKLKKHINDVLKKLIKRGHEDAHELAVKYGNPKTILELIQGDDVDEKEKIKLVDRLMKLAS